MNAKIERQQKEFVKAMKKKFADDTKPKKEDVSKSHPTIIVGSGAR